jgi:hypothetical protein
LTGHSHRIEKFGDAELLEHGGQLYLKVQALSARVVHEEHKAIALPQGLYRVWRLLPFDLIYRLISGKTNSA